MDKLEIKQGSFIQQTQYFIPDSRSGLFFVLNLMFTSREVCVVAGYIINHYCFTYLLSNNSSKELS
jgi:hypothetical protein